MLKNTRNLLAIMARLRHPETGCAWDVKQDFTSLMPYVIEEAYEVADAIERNDPDDLRSELGDLLLQVVFHSRIAEELGLFDFEEVSGAICEKLIHRHPQVFSDTVFNSDEERHRAWEQAKALERQRKNKTVEQDSVLAGVAGNLPALMECEKIQDRAANYGFDWSEVLPVFDKVREEMEEVREAWESGDQAHIKEEIGDLLLVVVNLARHLKVNPEIALKESTKKFSRRFQYVERQARASDRDLRDCDLAELDAFWNAAKKALMKR
ncbi:Nucleoside triphosphate pyrophosphohydrolase [Candidatus Methylobacter favarea]|uniref:Nucleoside triphosphate pyrophosphohydrolase n=1 Tax=Candidatus Methylobacter favarea TaxID=2707345 RepID=A0A8S0WSN0_9GAMM|nr:nucleoside triphosphate pyrophosphohydrolase [Candidatus Methylobacter favarea]CAA9892941.1 Nucleoside triphosphate pyrophosphohydrolase [Candidatus Methylobacter favarea]